MALKPRIPGIRNSWSDIDPVALDTVNYDTTAAKPNAAGVTADDPRGALSGMVAVLKGAGIVGVANPLVGSGEPDMSNAVGLFINNVRGDAFQSSSAVASGKAVYWDAYGVYETDVFELYTDVDVLAGTVVTPLVYAAGNLLYCSPRSFITNDDVSTKARSIGYVISPATPTNPFMVICLNIQDRLA